jgi:hypothetical protein
MIFAHRVSSCRRCRTRLQPGYRKDLAKAFPWDCLCTLSQLF